ncbi:MAG: PfkB family carbohydrate kinase, partial [Gaiellales bacterium]
MSEAPGIAVVGSVNLDLVAEVDRLPAPGETVTGACLTRVPGGKGANQALAAARLGARVRLVARTGDDDTAEQALALLREDGVDLDSCGRDEAAPTGVALVIVAAGAENQVVVASGANRELGARHVSVDPHEAVLVQLEIDDEAVVEAARQARRLLCVNAAPARSVPDSVLDRADLVVVNRVEAAALESR